MLAGQFLDLEAENLNKKPTIKMFNNIQEKNRSTYGILLLCWGIYRKCPKKELEILYEFGLILGRIFQITDDILDKEGNQKL